MNNYNIRNLQYITTEQSKELLLLHATTQMNLTKDLERYKEPRYKRVHKEFQFYKVLKQETNL